MTPPQEGDFREDLHKGSVDVWHIVDVGVPIGWVRLDIDNDFYIGEIDTAKRDVLVLMAVIAGVAILLLGGAIGRSRALMDQNETEIAQQQQLLENKAYYDALTKLPNRSLLYDRLHQAIARSERTGHPLAIGFLDLDNFKPVNDRHGHTEGDQVLTDIAQRLLGGIRGDDTVARFGGDEFVFLLNEIESPEEAETILLRLLATLHPPFTVAGHPIAIRASIGYVLYPEDADAPNSLLALADQAMYRAKEMGGDRMYRFRREG